MLNTKIWKFEKNISSPQKTVFQIKKVILPTEYD